MHELYFRCINGSTALHTAAYFGVIPVLKDLLHQGVDVNLLDYKGATALHRAKDTDTMQVRVHRPLSAHLLLSVPSHLYVMCDISHFNHEL